MDPNNQIKMNYRRATGRLPADRHLYLQISKPNSVPYLQICTIQTAIALPPSPQITQSSLPQLPSYNSLLYSSSHFQHTLPENLQANPDSKI